MQRQVSSTANDHKVDQAIRSFKFSEKTDAVLELQIIQALKERNRQLAEEFPDQIDELKLDENLTGHKLLGRKVVVSMPVCKSVLFDRLRKELGLTTAELIKAYRQAAEDKFTSLVGRENFTLEMFVHFRTAPETTSFYSANPGLLAVCQPIENRCKASIEVFCRAELQKLIARHNEEWLALLKKDCDAQERRGKGVVFDREAQAEYFVELCVHYLSFMITEKYESYSASDIAKNLKNNPIGVIITNDAHPDNVYSFAKAHVSEMDFPIGLGANGFAYVTIDKVEPKPREEPKAYLQVLEMPISSLQGPAFFVKDRSSSESSSMSSVSSGSEDEDETIDARVARTKRDKEAADAKALLYKSLGFFESNSPVTLSSSPEKKKMRAVSPEVKFF